ncbi:MAG: hypothetical protein COB02_09025 [Candidatus Cloacimonadota bacterium]|nr:MAG: hypothetical protein COB02_09025 [Candidatus Cloacimonadota bacterium]
MSLDETLFVVELEVIEEKLSSLKDLTAKLFSSFEKRSLDEIASLVAKREGVINGFFNACSRVNTKLLSNELYKEKPLNFLLKNSTGFFHSRIEEILASWENILVFESKIQKLAKSLPNLMKENLKMVQKARPALKAYSTILDVNSLTEPRFERKK